MKNFFQQKNRTLNINFRNRGFTLIETLVAISIFSLSVVTFMSVMSNGISNTEYAKEKITATFLAQEGIEYIRNVRDTYIASDPSGGWASFRASVNSKCSSAGGCYFNPDSISYSDQSMPITKMAYGACTGTCPLLLYQTTTGKYDYSSGDTSIYSRKINVVAISGTTDEIEIISTVSWKQNSKPYSINLSENLYNWTE